jgi:tRNA G10  N-methylase Trm11
MKNSIKHDQVLYLALKKSFRKDYKTNSRKKDYFDGQSFFEEWFRGNGESYFFVFRKNLRVTNIQFAELASLIRQYCQDKDTNNTTDKHIQFCSVYEFKELIQGMMNSLTSLNPEQRSIFLAEHCQNTIENKIVIDCFYGSCAVFVPHNLMLDHRSICAYSGYVHNCGKNIYIRNTEKANKDELIKKLENYCSENITENNKIWFEVFAHSKTEQKGKTFQDSLDSLRIFVEKFYIGETPLVEVLTDLEEKFQDKLIVNVSGVKEIQEEKEKRDKTKSIWLLVDNSINLPSMDKGKIQYFICYIQEYKNENPLYVFKENKPAKIASITIPNTLSSAMINIAEFKNGAAGKCNILDPFAGTGTTFFEAIKHESVDKVICNDVSAKSQQLFFDNYEFFTSEIDKLNEYLKYFKDDKWISSHKLDVAPQKQLQEYYDNATNFIKENKEKLEKDQDIELRKDLCFEAKLILYFAIKVFLKNIKSFANIDNWETLYKREINEFLIKLDKFITIKKKISGCNLVESQNYMTFLGTYSTSCSIDIKKEIELNQFFKIGDMLDILEDCLFDIIVTDPPYGFNVKMEGKDSDLANLYIKAIEKMFKLLSDDGQIIISLPDRSYNGQKLSFFTRKEFVIKQILLSAHNNDYEVIVPAKSLPQQGTLFCPPYYWNSERALSRSILHFKFRKKR